MAKHKHSKATAKRAAARHSGRRQIPFPHEHLFMTNNPAANDPDHDGDNDAADTDNDAATA